ncbi:hypothetical protein GEMRC1_002347 [Eukaryota sp. GEM-RC1]
MELQHLSSVEDQLIGSVTFGQQFSSLWRKNLILQRKATCLNLCAILTPLCLLLLTLLLNLLAPHLPEDFGNIYIPADPNPVTVYFDLTMMSMLNHDGTPRESPLSIPVSSSTDSVEDFLTHVPSIPFNDHQFPTFKHVDDIEEFVMGNWDTTGDFPPTVALHFNDLSTGSKPVLDVTVMFDHVNTTLLTTVSRQATLNSLITAFLAYLGKSLTIVTGWRGIVHEGRDIIVDMEGLMAPFVASVSFHLALGVLVTPLVAEKESGLLDVCVQMGLKKSVYHTASFLFNLIVYFCMCVILLVFAFIFNISFFVNTPAMCWLTIIIVFSFTVMAKVQLFATLFSRSKWTTFAMFLYVILISDTAVDTLMMINPNPSDDHWLTWFPSVALVKIFNLFAYFGSDEVDSLNNWDMFNSDLLFPVLMGKILISTVVVVILTFYFEVTLSQKFGRHHDWLFFLSPSFYKKSSDETFVDDGTSEDAGNDDVLIESKAAHTDASASLRVIDLHHVYKGSDVPAVKGISFTAKKGQILALIGSNGSGKTTTISTLSGLFQPSKGDAYVCGKNIRTDMSEIYKFLGVCPQADALYQRLSARDHLIFFANLKGYPKESVSGIVDNALESVNLTAFADRDAGKFSGGMRRRLSLAISLLGRNSMVFLDEPTTGVDVANANEIWKTIKSNKEGKTIMLTSHSFEEIEALADKVVILNKGMVTSVGSPLQLKAKYGSGYKVSITCNSGHVSKVKERVIEAIPEALHSFELAEFVTYVVPLESTSFSLLFKLIRDMSNDGLIKDFSVGHSSLEEVYMSLTG